MASGDYGKGHGSSKGDKEYFIKGSPDHRAKTDPYASDMYDRMTPRNKSASGKPNKGIQGNPSSQTQNANKSIKGTRKSYKSSYGGPAGNPVDNSVGSGNDKDYAKG